MERKTAPHLLINVLTPLLFSYLIFCILLNIIWLVFTRGFGDFGSFYSSAQAFLLGNDPYASGYTYVSRPFLDGISIASPNLNPPISWYLFIPLTLAPIHISYFIWVLVLIAFYTGSIVLLFRHFSVEGIRLKILWTAALGGLWQTLQVGQIYPPLLFLLVGAYIFAHSNRHLIAGILLGIICAIKPSFLILVFFLVFLDKKQMLLSAAATFVFVSLIPVIFMGLDIYMEWVAVSSAYTGINFPLNSTFIGLFSRLGDKWIGYVLSGLCFLGATWLIYKKHPGFNGVFYLGLLCSLLCSPISWAGYMMFLIPALFTYVNWKSTLLIPILLLCTPVTTVYGFTNPNHLIVILWGWMYGFSLLWLFLHEVLQTIGVLKQKTAI